MRKCAAALPPTLSAANGELLLPQSGDGDDAGAERDQHPLLKIIHGNVLGGEEGCVAAAAAGLLALFPSGPPHPVQLFMLVHPTPRSWLALPHSDAVTDCLGHLLLHC